MNCDFSTGDHGQHESFQRQIHRVSSVAVLLRERSNGIERDVDPRGLADDAVDVLIDGCVIQRIDHRRVRTPAVCRDLPGHLYHVGLSPAGEKDFRSFRGDLLGHR